MPSFFRQRFATQPSHAIRRILSNMKQSLVIAKGSRRAESKDNRIIASYNSDNNIARLGTVSNSANNMARLGTVSNFYLRFF